MRSLIIVFILSFASVTSTFAQPHNREKGKKIDALKVAFISKKLDLSPQEAEQFWPVYNNYQHELMELFHEKRKLKHSENGPDQRIDDELSFETRILDLKKKYRTEFKKVLTPEKTMVLFKAEREFREQLINELKDRRKDP